MAGPIIEALRRMRANRMERRAMGGGFTGGTRGGLIRDMLNLRPPVTQNEALDAVDEYGYGRPVRRGGLFSSIGTGSGRQDRRGGPIMRPVARKMQPDPAGPDTEYKRDYDGDGRGDPVQGGTEDLPAPDTAVAAGQHPTAQLDEVARLDQELAKIQAGMGDPRLTRDQRDALVTQATLLNQRLKNAREDRQRAEERESGTVAAKIGQLEPLFAKAAETGDWEPVGAATAAMYIQKDEKGVPLPGQDIEAIGRRSAAPYILRFGRQAMQEHGDFRSIPENTRFAMLNGYNYAFPIPPDAVKNPAVMEDWKQRTFNAFEAAYNYGGDAETSDFHDALVHAMVSMQLGR